MNNQRPVNLDSSTFMSMPITAYVSILHRVSGVALFAGIAVLLWMLDLSLSSEQSFVELQALLSGNIAKCIVWLTLSALAYHTVMGLRHLIMDCGLGESLEGGRRGAKIALVLAILSIIGAGLWIW